MLNKVVRVFPYLPLEEATRKNWENAGAVIGGQVGVGDVVVNLGHRNMRLATINSDDTVRILSSPSLTRRFLGKFLPTNKIPHNSMYWYKEAGNNGKGKRLLCNVGGGVQVAPTKSADIQLHIDGPEYRVYTLYDGDGVRGLALYRKERDKSGDFRFTLLGRDASNEREQRVMDVAVDCARALSLEVRALQFVGWDVIVDSATGEAYILEGNTCPWVGSVSARWFVEAFRGVRAVPEFDMIVCPLCGCDAPYRNKGGVHEWACEDCPFIGREQY